MEIEAKRLQDEFVALKLAIEEAIIKGLEPTGECAEIPSDTLASNGYSISARTGARPGVIGWVDDL
jgi:hypothetical protein